MQSCRPSRVATNLPCSRAPWRLKAGRRMMRSLSVIGPPAIRGPLGWQPGQRMPGARDSDERQKLPAQVPG